MIFVIVHEFASKITYNNSDIDHGKKLLNDETIVVLQIPQEQLINWHGLKRKGHDLSYANFVNSTSAVPFIIAHNPRLEKRIADAACLAKKECHGKSGRKRQELLKKKRCIKLCDTDIDKPIENNSGEEILAQHHSVEWCATSNHEFEKRCSELVLELSETKEKLRNVDASLNKCEAQKSLLKEENATLANYIKKIENLNVCRNCVSELENHSRTLKDVGTRQRQRK